MEGRRSAARPQDGASQPTDSLGVQLGLLHDKCCLGPNQELLVPDCQAHSKEPVPEHPPSAISIAVQLWVSGRGLKCSLRCLETGSTSLPYKSEVSCFLPENT